MSLVFTRHSSPFLVKQSDVKSDLKPWEQLAEIYPGLVEPLRESWNDPVASQRKIFMITPTKTRAEQAADLTRLAQTLYLVNGHVLCESHRQSRF